MTHDEFVEILKSYLRDKEGADELQKIIEESKAFIEDAKKYDPILAEHFEQLISDMKRVQSYVETFYKLS
jgi:hypothetical protein